VIASAATCQATAGLFTQNSAACDYKGRSNLHPALPARFDPQAFFSHRAHQHCDRNGDTLRPPPPNVRTVVLSVLVIVLPSSSSVPPLMEATAPRSCTNAAYPGQMTARTRAPTAGILA
jgi:hypothetical protein